MTLKEIALEINDRATAIYIAFLLDIEYAAWTKLIHVGGRTGYAAKQTAYAIDRIIADLETQVNETPHWKPFAGPRTYFKHLKRTIKSRR